MFFFAAESQGQGWFGKFKLDGEPDYYTDSSASFVPAVGLSKPRDIAERRKLISDKPDITGGWSNRGNTLVILNIDILSCWQKFNIL